jgi:TrmH family RNA methyltransferase
LDSTDLQIQNLFKVILLEPKDSLNVGSVARAMMNFGFRDLCLVRPRDVDLDLAARTARRAAIILEGTQIVDSEEQAYQDVKFVAGFSTKFSKNTPPVILLPQLGSEIEKITCASNQKIALLFGPEDTGLRYDDLPACNVLVRIPSSDEYDSLNLAQAAMLVFYEIAKKQIKPNTLPTEGFADAASFLILDDMIDRIAEKSQFKHLGTPHNTMNLLKNLFRRPNLLEREMQILLGFFSRILKNKEN